MLTRADVDAKLQQCESWARWKPLQPRSILALALHDEGYSGGVEIRAVGRQKYQALVIATQKTLWVKPSDLIMFDIGKGEELQTIHGETLFWISETNVDGIDDDFWQPPQQTASGLWVPA